MKAHLAKVSLALLSAVFLLGCQEQGSEPVGPDGLGPAFNVDFCVKHPDHQKCNGPPPPETEDATFTVEVFFGGTLAGSFPEAVAKGGDSRPGIALGQGNTITLDVDVLNGALAGCTTTFDFATGQFAIPIARIPKSSPDLTLVIATFFNFEVDGGDYSLTFAPDGHGVISDSDNWRPADQGDFNIIRHPTNALELGQKNGPCNGRITQDWEIRVTKN